MRERVSAFVDEENSELERAAVRRHLGECSDCREFVAFSRGVQARARRSMTTPVAAVPSAEILSRAARRRPRAPGGLRRRALGLAAALMIGVVTGAIGTEVVIHEREVEPVPAPVLYQPKIAPGTPLDPDFVRYFETAPKPPMVFPEVLVIDPLPPDPSFRWAGLEPGVSYPEGYVLELVSY